MYLVVVILAGFMASARLAAAAGAPIPATAVVSSNTTTDALWLASEPLRSRAPAAVAAIATLGIIGMAAAAGALADVGVPSADQPDRPRDGCWEPAEFSGSRAVDAEAAARPTIGCRRLGSWWCGSGVCSPAVAAGDFDHIDTFSSAMSGDWC